ncbi:LysR family transcriptional regulator [Actibacterium sp. 188UL27-1]|uniref:LysR family transcriptional regulator n=1 Tax=Actibacterium sp. 188UL27-1 TaxID=2786961 RepID=UPI00195B619A|nr:LysR family transcriptional regulator [Actibacterium sp. 188UL27-1]MBM7066173.1 LysR family transcriptional regulator [Actibacterium sp. 188UL27-1]
MNWKSIAFDWNQARAFLATAEEGSLSAAARALGQTQPTLSRQVAALEQDLGVILFERVGRTLTLTQSGIDLLDHFRAMGDAASRISLGASGQSQQIEGRVVITAAEMMASYRLPPIIAKIRATAPGITLDIIAADDIRDLLRREADIAIRHAEPTQSDLIAKRLPDATARPYASTAYLDQRGRPLKPSDLHPTDILAYERTERFAEMVAAFGLPVSEDAFSIVSASGTVMHHMIREGLGIGLLPDMFATTDPDLEPVLPDADPVPFPVWLVTHRELHNSRRIRIVFDILAEELS